MADDASREGLSLNREPEPRTLRSVIDSITHTRTYEYTALFSNLAVIGVGTVVSVESLVQGNPLGAGLGAGFAVYSAFTVVAVEDAMEERKPKDGEKSLVRTGKE